MAEQQSDETFEKLVREMVPGAVGATEHVAAIVSRERRFANIGTGASGHELRLDEPTQFGGSGSGPDPAEALLIAIGSSLSVTLTVHAALAKLRLDHVDIALKGKLDPMRFFKPSDESGAGLYDFEVDVTLGGDAREEQLRALLDTALQASPVLRSIDAAPTVRLTVRELA